MPLQPQAAEAVFYHVADDPICSVKAGCSRDIFLFNCTAVYVNNFIVPLRNIVLIQPADDLDFVPAVIIQARHFAQDGIGLEQGGGKKQLCHAGDLLEHAGQPAAQRVAQGD